MHSHEHAFEYKFFYLLNIMNILGLNTMPLMFGCHNMLV